MATKRPKSLMRGLSIVRGPDAEGRWYWRYRANVDGALVTLWAGWATPSQAKAEAIAAAASPSGRAAVEDPRPSTVRELLRVWLRSQAERVTEDRAGQLADQIRPSTLVVYQRTARQLCPPAGQPRHGAPTDLGEVLLGELREDHLRRWRDQSGLAPATCHTGLLVLRAAWAWARGRGLVAGDCPRVATSTRTTRPKITPSPGEAAEIIAAATGWKRVALLLLATTGARVGELGALTLDRLRLPEAPGERAEIMLWEKGAKGRWVPLIASVAEELRAWLADRREGRRTDRRPDTILGVAPVTVGVELRKHLARLAVAAGDETHSTPHSLRRLASSTLLGSGVDPVTYERIMGHSWKQGIASYAESGAATRAAAVDLLQLPAGRVIPFPGTASGTGRNS